MSRIRFPLLALAVIALLMGIFTGWVRIGWRWPALQPLVMVHGPLMVSGFLGTLIALERAVALRKRWMYAAPLFSGFGGLLLLLGLKGIAGPLLLTLGSLVLMAILVIIVRQHLAIYTLVMAVGVLCWLIGNTLWLIGWPIYQVVMLWAEFLVLTIAAERLELGRIIRLSQQAEMVFVGLAGLSLLGLLVMVPAYTLGVGISSAGFFGLALWLLRFDIARRTIRQKGLPRFAAICLLLGYFWLGVGGLMGMISGGQIAGFQYDAILHSIFVGFVISMIFGHAPIIFPAVLGLPIKFYPIFYSHLVLLHVSMVMRLAGDLTRQQSFRQWGGLLSGIAILLFLVNTGLGIAKSSLISARK